MNVGLLETEVSHQSQTNYWRTFLHELDLSVLTPQFPTAELFDIGRQSLQSEPLHVQLALGRLLSLENESVDAVLVPQWEGVSGEVWADALHELLPRRISSLPHLVHVPNAQVALDELERVAVQVGMQFLPNGGGQVRRALECVRSLAPIKNQKSSWPLLSLGSHDTLGIIGSAHLLDEPLFMQTLHDKFSELAVHPVYGHRLPRSEVLHRATRMPDFEKRPLGEHLVFGAASLLGSKGAVRGLVFVHSEHDTGTRQTYARIAEQMRKPSLLIELSYDTQDMQDTQGDLGSQDSNQNWVFHDHGQLTNFVQQLRRGQK